MNTVLVFLNNNRIMTQISQEDLQKFKEIYYKEFNKEIDDSEALELAKKLVTLVSLICKETEQ